MDLLKPLYEQDRLHPHFRTISDGRPGRLYQREELQRWLDGFPDRDNKFVREFQTTFNSSFWEIYLHAVFREYGFAFDWTYPAPDFLVSSADITFTVEATTANHSIDATPEWGRPMTAEFFEDVDFNELNRVAIIRLANAFMSKSQKFQDKYQHHPHVQGRPFVLAVAPFEQPGFNLQAYRAIEALLFDYYVDEAEYLANPERFPNGLEGKSLGSVQKDNGAEIELGFFDCLRFSHISAVIFSNLATWGKVDAMCGNPDAVISSVWSLPNGEMKRTVSRGNEASEGITDGLRIYHNPFATTPLPLEVFRREGVMHMWADPYARSLISEQAENCLQSRTAMTFFVKDDDPSCEGLSEKIQQCALANPARQQFACGLLDILNEYRCRSYSTNRSRDGYVKKPCNGLNRLPSERSTIFLCWGKLRKMRLIPQVVPEHICSDDFREKENGK